MAKWTAFPYDDTSYAHDGAGLKKHWARLHIGDAEPLPKEAAVLTAWGHFHAGDFQKAHDAGLKAGGAGITVANKAQSIYATYLEKSEKTRLAMFQEVAARAEARSPKMPRTPMPTTGWPMRWAAMARASAWPRRWPRAWAAR